MGEAVSADDILRSDNFDVEFDSIGAQEIVRITGGGVSFAVKDATQSNRKGNLKMFACGKPNYDDLTLERLYINGRNGWKDWVNEFREGKRAVDIAETGSVVYNLANGDEARRYNFFGPFPKSYDCIAMDSRNPDAVKEIIVLEVQRIEYK